MNNMLEEFKKFALKGNVMDLAVAVIIGAAFGKIVTSLVDNVLMPLIGLLLGGIDFTGLSYKVGDATVEYGRFIQASIDFVIIAFVIFLLVKVLNRLTAKEAEKPEEEKVAEPTEEVKLLREIRDSLQSK